MFGLFKSAADLAVDVATIAVAPVQVVVDLAGAAVHPVAEVAKEVVEAAKRVKD